MRSPRSSGVDFVPPRRRLRRAEFRRIDPRAPRPARATFVEDFAPTVVAHFGVYEPASRMSPASAIERTELCTIVDAERGRARRQARVRRACAAGSRCTDRVHGSVVGARRRRCRPRRRRRTACSLLEVEAVVAGPAAAATACRSCALRYAPVVGSHVPSPLGRLLRLPVVPVPRVRRPAVPLLHPDDAAVAMVAAIDRRSRRPAQHRRPRRRDARGRRCGSAAASRCRWSRRCCGRGAAGSSSFAGAAIAPHVVELLRHGCTGDGQPRGRGARAHATAFRPSRCSRELFEWADIVSLTPNRSAA